MRPGKHTGRPRSAVKSFERDTEGDWRKVSHLLLCGRLYSNVKHHRSKLRCSNSEKVSIIVTAILEVKVSHDFLLAYLLLDFSIVLLAVAFFSRGGHSYCIQTRSESCSTQLVFSPNQMPNLGTRNPGLLKPAASIVDRLAASN